MSIIEKLRPGDRAAPPRRRDGIHDRQGNLYTNREGTWAVYKLRPTYTADLSEAALDDLIRDFADRVADHAGTVLWLRVTSVPFPSDDYERKLAAPLGDRVVDPAVRDAMVSAAAWWPRDAPTATADGGRVVTKRLDSRWPVAVVAVRLTTTVLDPCDLSRFAADAAEPAGREALSALRSRYRDVAASAAATGWWASPLGDDELTWLHDASVALGHNIDPPRPGEPSALHDAEVRSVQDPDGVTVPVTVDWDGTKVTRHARVLRLDTWHERDTARVPAWIEWAMTRPYRVDVAARFEVRTPDESVEKARSLVRRNADIAGHLERFGRTLSRKEQHAVRRGPELIDDMESGIAAIGCQMQGQVVFAVSGATVEEAVAVAKEFRAAAGAGHGDDDSRGPGLLLKAVPAQWAEARKFIPGHSWDVGGRVVGHVQWASPLMIASGLPHATRRAGDSTGAPFGPIAASTDYYVFDFFGGVRRDQPGVWGVIGDQGSGKSTILTFAAIWGSIVEQVPATVLDPSGRIASQLRIPELRGQVREIRLDAEGAPGTLASHFVTRDPRRDLYATDDEYESAVEAARTTRIEAAIDNAVAALPTAASAADPDVIDCIRAAVTGVGGEYGVQPSEIIDAIRADGPTGQRIARQIESYAAMSGGKLLWRDRVAGDYTAGGDDLVTLVSVAGITPPRDPDPSSWTTAERRSVVLLAGAAQLSTMHIWRDNAPKLYLVDEASQLLSGTSAFLPLLSRAAFDSRKVACSFGVAMHLSDSLSPVAAYAASLFGAAALLRTERSNAVAALPMLRTSPGRGWEDLAPRLTSGEMIMSGWDDKLVRTRFDQGWLSDEIRAQLGATSPLAKTEPLRSLFGAQS